MLSTHASWFRSVTQVWLSNSLSKLAELSQMKLHDETFDTLRINVFISSVGIWIGQTSKCLEVFAERLLYNGKNPLRCLKRNLCGNCVFVCLLFVWNEEKRTVCLGKLWIVWMAVIHKTTYLKLFTQRIIGIIQSDIDILCFYCMLSFSGLEI